MIHKDFCPKLAEHNLFSPHRISLEAKLMLTISHQTIISQVRTFHGVEIFLTKPVRTSAQ